MVEDAIQERKVVARDSVSALASYSRSLAHSLNNVIGISRGNLMLLRNRLTDQESLDLLSEAIKALDQGEVLARNTSLLSNWEVYSARNVNLRAFIEARRDRLAHLLDGLTIEWSIEGEPEAWVDPEYLELALNAMVVNAREAAVDGKPAHIRIAVAMDTGNKVSVHVMDSGKGVVPEFSHVVFDAGFTLKKGGHAGLGLWFVSEFARTAGGTVWIENMGAGGAALVLNLPATSPRSESI